MSERAIKKAGPDWYTIKEAAQYLGIGEPTLYRWMRDRKITFRKIGDSTRFLKDDLDSAVQIFYSEKVPEEVKQVCPVCHGETLCDGRLRSTGLLHFQVKKSKFWTLKDSNVKTDGKICSRCGAITLFGDVKKLNRIIEAEKPEDLSQAATAANK